MAIDATIEARAPSWGTFPGGFWGVHGMSVDAEGNFYTAEVDNGRVQRFRPLPDVNPSYRLKPP